jgi:hypothetical protein
MQSRLRPRKKLQMLKSTIETFKQNIITYLLIFFVGNTIGGLGAYYSLSKDCSVMGMFRVADTAFSCKRLAP